jgi:hypothetical protein
MALFLMSDNYELHEWADKIVRTCRNMWGLFRAKAVSCWLCTMAAQVQAKVRPCGRQSRPNSGRGFKSISPHTMKIKTKGCARKRFWLGQTTLRISEFLKALYSK